MESRDLEYYQKRERQEREKAARANVGPARRAHLEMADRYSSILLSLPPGSSVQA